MNNLLLLLLSILIYSVYSQQCGNTHPQQTLLSISINGASVNKIGTPTEYLNIVNSAADTLLPETPTVGIQTFGGITSDIAQGTGVLSEQSLGASTYATVESTIADITGFDNNLGNVVSEAMISATTILENESGQKYHVIFAAGNPLANGAGIETDPSDRDDPCVAGRDAKQKNIQTYVVLIGEQGVNFVKEFYSCLVENPATDIIIIDPASTSAGLSALSNALCKTDGIDVKITEVNPDGSYKPYIEIFNRGARIANVRGCWGTGTTDCSDVVTLKNGEYFVAFDSVSEGESVTSGSGYQHASGLTGEGITSTSWTATVQDDDSNTYDIVTYNENTWQKPRSQQSFELREPGYNNTYATNWRTSCDHGSPGLPPQDCENAENSCDEAVCSQNGDSSNEGCEENPDYCLCSSYYLQDGNNCLVFPEPANCRAYIIYDEVTQKNWTYYAFDEVEYDGDVVYSMQYIDANGQTQRSSSFGTAAYAVDTFGDSTQAAFNIDVTASFKPPIRDSRSSQSNLLICQVIYSEAGDEDELNPVLLIIIVAINAIVIIIAIIIIITICWRRQKAATAIQEKDDEQESMLTEEQVKKRLDLLDLDKFEDQHAERLEAKRLKSVAILGSNIDVDIDVNDSDAPKM